MPPEVRQLLFDVILLGGAIIACRLIISFTQPFLQWRQRRWQHRRSSGFAGRIVTFASGWWVRRLNEFFQPYRGQVSSERLRRWLGWNLCALCILYLLPFVPPVSSSPYLPSWNAFRLGLAALFVALTCLTVVAKFVMIAEDRRILDGELDKGRAKFRLVQGAVPIELVLMAPIFLLLGLGIVLQSIDSTWPGLGFVDHGPVALVDFVTLLIRRLLAPGLGRAGFGPLDVDLEAVSWLGFAISVILWVAFSLIVWKSLHVYFDQTARIAALIVGLEDSDEQSATQFLQQRASRFPDRLKQILLQTALAHPKPLMRRRAMSIMPYMEVATWPGVFLFSLHREPDDDLRQHGLQKIEDLLERESTKYTDEDMRRMRNAHRLPVDLQSAIREADAAFTERGPQVATNRRCTGVETEVAVLRCMSRLSPFSLSTEPRPIVSGSSQLLRLATARPSVNSTRSSRHTRWQFALRW